MTIDRQAFDKFSKNAKQDVASNEAQTKQFLIEPFFRALGYDVSSPDEFVPEYTADFGTLKGAKVDYAIKRNGKVVIIVEAKKLGAELNAAKEGQLMKYFAATDAKIGILTDGVIYRLYSDLEKQNIMDQVPFYELNILAMDDQHFEELNHLSADEFDIGSMIKGMQERNRVNGIIDYFKQQLEGKPDKDFVKFLMKIVEPNVIQTATRVREFGPIIQHALKQFRGVEVSDDDIEPPDPVNGDGEEEDKKPITRIRMERLAFCYYSLNLRIHGYSNSDIGQMLAEFDFLGNRNATPLPTRVGVFFTRNDHAKITGIPGKGPNTDPDILREAAERVWDKINNELDAETADRISETYQHMLTRLQESA